MTAVHPKVSQKIDLLKEFDLMTQSVYDPLDKIE